MTTYKYNIQTQKMGEVWVACEPILQVSSIGKTEADAILGVLDAISSHVRSKSKRVVVPLEEIRKEWS